MGELGNLGIAWLVQARSGVSLTANRSEAEMEGHGNPSISLK